MLRRHFSARLAVKSNWIQEPVWIVFPSTPLPPGLSLDTRAGVISGTPTQSGFWTVRIGVRDRVRGFVPPDSNPATAYSTRDFELKIFDELRGER